MRHDGGWRVRASRTVHRNPHYAVREDPLTLPGGHEIASTGVDSGLCLETYRSSTTAAF